MWETNIYVLRVGDQQIAKWNISKTFSYCIVARLLLQGEGGVQLSQVEQSPSQVNVITNQSPSLILLRDKRFLNAFRETNPNSFYKDEFETYIEW